MQQLGLPYNFNDLLILQPSEAPRDVPCEAVRGEIARYFADQVQTAVSEAVDGPGEPMTVTQTARDTFDAHGTELRYLGTTSGARPDDEGEAWW